MRVKLVRSGGFAGLKMVASVDTGELPADQQDVVSRLLTEDLRGPGVSRPGGADQFSYQLEIQQGDSTVRRSWDEAEVHDAVRPLLASLTREAKPSR
ncbi:MAG TPA: protealysin inhibitor emfourin [Dermatophilaceae bacterium]